MSRAWSRRSIDSAQAFELFLHATQFELATLLPDLEMLIDHSDELVFEFLAFASLRGAVKTLDHFHGAAFEFLVSSIQLVHLGIVLGHALVSHRPRWEGSLSWREGRRERAAVQSVDAAADEAVLPAAEAAPASLRGCWRGG